MSMVRSMIMSGSQPHSCYPPYESRLHANLCHLTRSNDCPNNDDAETVRGSQHGIVQSDYGRITVRGLLRGWNSEVAAIQHQIQALQDRFRKLEASYQLYKPILAPIRLLPREILGEIFSYVVSQSCLIDICGVCKTWRDAAYVTLSLWQHTAVNLDRWSSSQTYDSVEAWMSRSKAFPKSLTLRSPHCSGTYSELTPGRRSYHCTSQDGIGKCRLQTTVVEKLLTARHTLSHVTIRPASPRCLIQLVAYILTFYDHQNSSGSAWDSLRSVTISASEWVVDDECVPPHTFSFLPDSIRILRLDLPRHARTPYKLRMELPPETLERLTSLTLTCDWTGDWIFKTLRHCTNLEVLELYLQNGEIVRWEREDDPYMRSIFRPESGLTLPNLHTLLVDGLPVDGHVELVALRLPSLRDISITFDSANRGACGKAWVCIPGEDDLILAKAVRGNCGTRESGVSTLHLGNIRLFGDHDHHGPEKSPRTQALNPRPHLGRRLRRPVLLGQSLDVVPRLETLALLGLHEEPSGIGSNLFEFIEVRQIKLTFSMCK
ncbi:hypothetical protein FA13DRAFT_58162 [Coprinellus micaceus]|uniref:F-box domain-containing protein n=1 Tax=Coprinellus micaceus TaxID=71717 RepID=A0A4Y7U302_COPMI|nr:hypothetical protein FA13DRAFT_58162 [Coprinellus micaceus]